MASRISVGWELIKNKTLVIIQYPLADPLCHDKKASSYNVILYFVLLHMYANNTFPYLLRARTN